MASTGPGDGGTKVPAEENIDSAASSSSDSTVEAEYGPVLSRTQTHPDGRWGEEDIEAVSVNTALEEFEESAFPYTSRSLLNAAGFI